MPEQEPRNSERFYRWLLRFSFALLMIGFAFLLSMIFSMIGRLENLAPAELKLLLEIVKNRFFR